MDLFMTTCIINIEEILIKVRVYMVDSYDSFNLITLVHIWGKGGTQRVNISSLALYFFLFIEDGSLT